MRRSGLICSVIALVLFACTGDGGTTTSPAAGGVPYPWVEEQRAPVPPGSILPALDGIEYGTGDLRQVPCPGCGQEVDEGEIESHGQGNLQCDHPVDYVANQLIVLDPKDAFVDFFAGLGGEAEDITPELIVEEGEWISPDGLVQRTRDEHGREIVWPAGGLRRRQRSLAPSEIGSSAEPS